VATAGLLLLATLLAASLMAATFASKLRRRKGFILDR